MTSKSTEEHRAKAAEHAAARVAVLTISDTRTRENDGSGDIIARSLKATGHTVVERRILRDEPAEIRACILKWAGSEEVDAILTNGGTGIAPRDGTYEAVAGLLDRTLPGFGEIFRMLSWQEVGAASMLSRAIAGLHGRCLIFCMPGSTNAVQLAMDKLIAPELGHMMWEMNGKKSLPPMYLRY